MISTSHEQGIKTIIIFLLLGFFLAGCAAKPSPRPQDLILGKSPGPCGDKTIYMGCDVDVRQGHKGEIANAALIEHGEQFSKKLYKVTDGVYSLVGYGLANAHMIEGEEGIIIIDTGDGVEMALEHLEEFRKVTQKPVTAIILTHFHYAFGTQAYLAVDENRDIPVYGHELLHDTYVNIASEIGQTFVRRLAIQFGLHLPMEGPDAMPNMGIGPYFLDMRQGIPTNGYVQPTHIISDGDDLVIDGVRFHFANFASDSPDTLVIYLPDKKVAVNNHFWPAVANMYTLRGGRFRDPEQWVGGIDYMRKLDVEHLVNVHGPPLSGREAISHSLRNYRDAVQYIYDQSVRGINKGLGPDELRYFVELPPHLADDPYINEHYGEVALFPKQIFMALLGWYGTDAATIHPVPPRIEAERIVDGFGGTDAVLAKVQEAMADREYAWAAQLVTYVLRLDPDHAAARQLKADALRRMGQATPASITRNFYLTQALELEGKVDRFDLPPALITEEVILRSRPGFFVRALRFALDPEKSADVDQVFGIYFSDIDQGFGMHVRKGVAEYLDHFPENPDLAISLSRTTWARMLLGKTGLAGQVWALLTGELEVTTGNTRELRQFFGMFDQQRR